VTGSFCAQEGREYRRNLAAEYLCRHRGVSVPVMKGGKIVFLGRLASPAFRGK